MPGERGKHDRAYALSTLALAAATGLLTAQLIRAGIIVLGTEWPGLATAAREALVYVVLFETYFYALHRLLHRRWLFRRIHIVHHHSASPTVMTGLAFHPVEALLIMSFLPVAMWLVPIHLAALAVASVFLSGSILLAHSGADVFPGWWPQVPGLNWYVTPAVHALHHARGDCNYGATLSLCDRAFGTLGTGARARERSLAA